MSRANRFLRAHYHGGRSGVCATAWAALSTESQPPPAGGVGAAFLGPFDCGGCVGPSIRSALAGHLILRLRGRQVFVAAYHSLGILERHEPIDVLATRDAEPLVEWRSPSLEMRG